METYNQRIERERKKWMETRLGRLRHAYGCLLAKGVHHIGPGRKPGALKRLNRLEVEILVEESKQQLRYSLSEVEMEIEARDGLNVHLRDIGSGDLELWRQNDKALDFVIVIDGVGYEFIETLQEQRYYDDATRSEYVFEEDE